MLEALFFYVLASVLAGSALAIVFTRDIVRAATWLFGALLAVAGLYGLLAAQFLMAVQLIVYAGGILILIVFGVMLTAREVLQRSLPRGREVLLAGSIAVLLFVTLAGLSLRALATPPLDPAAAQPAPTVAGLGHAFLTSYWAQFELISLLLLAVMIGAAYMARPESRVE